MSGYGSMKASPFWTWTMRITGILCFVTLMTPPMYYAKYALLDRPGERAIASSKSNESPFPPLQFRYIDLECRRAEHGATAPERIEAVDWLSRLVLTPYAQVSHPFECLSAKTTLNTVGSSDPNPGVKSAAVNGLVQVAQNGAVIKR